MIFYFKKKKGVSEPCTQNQILQLIVHGKIYITHECCCVLDEKSSRKFRPIYQMKEFYDFFPQKKDPLSWTLLKRYKKTFVQSGPYLKTGLQILLKKGLISDQDFVWKEGFSSWERLSLCAEFHTRKDASIEDLMDQLDESCPQNFSPHIVYYKHPVYSDWSKWRK